MWPPGSSNKSSLSSSPSKRSKLVTRMSLMFRRGTTTTTNNKKNSDGGKRGSAVADGRLKDKSLERVRPPLIEGRAERATDVFEYVAYPPPPAPPPPASTEAEEVKEEENEDDNNKKKNNPVIVSADEDKCEEKVCDDAANNNNNNNNNGADPTEMGSPQVDRSPPAPAEASTAQLLALGPGGSNNNTSSSSSSTSSRLRQQQQQQSPPSQQQQQDQVSPSTTNTGSENSRDLEEPAEGSVDPPTPSSEASTPPAYVRWTESIYKLLDDGDGVQTFMDYLADDELDYYMKFWICVNALKVMEPKKVVKAIDMIIKRFLDRLECLDGDMVDSIKAKRAAMAAASATTSDGGSGDANGNPVVDVNMFDGAQQRVVEHMKTFYLNFLKSEHYIRKIQEMQGAYDDAGSCRQSGTISSASSVSGRQAPSSDMHPADRGLGAVPKTRDRGARSSVSVSGSSIASSGGTLTHQGQQGQQQQQQHPSSSKQQDSSSAAPSFSSTSLEPLDEENAVQSFQRAGGSGGQPVTPTASSRSRGRSGTGRQHPTSDLAPGPPSSSGRVGESTAATVDPLGDIHPDLRKLPSAPYHARASTFNPVSRNDSEIQSQSSGALDGDGNTYSQRPPQPHHHHHHQQQHYSTASRSQQYSRPSRDREHHERHHRHVNAGTDLTLLKHSLHRDDSKEARGLKYDSLAKTNTSEFAAFLCKKLQAVVNERSGDKKLKAKLAAVSDPGVVPPGAEEIDESDQSILDDHCSRVFTDDVTPPRSPRRSRRPNVSMNRSTHDVTFGGGGQMSQSFSTGTWGHGNRSGYHGGSQQQQQHQFGEFGGGRSAFSSSSAGFLQHMPQQHNRSMGPQSYRGDLAYYPNDDSRSLRQRQRAAQDAAAMERSGMAAAGGTTSRSLSDFGGNFGGGGGRSHQFGLPPQQLPSLHSQQHQDRLNTWVSHQHQHHHQQQLQPSGGARSTSMSRATGNNRISPRSSGRHQAHVASSSGRHRARSQERGATAFFQQQQQQQQAQSVHGAMQQPSSYSGPEIQLLYRFSAGIGGARDSQVYLVRYQGPPQSLTVGEIKKRAPKKGNFRYFVHTSIGEKEEILEEITRDHEVVPVRGQKVKIDVEEDGGSGGSRS